MNTANFLAEAFGNAPKKVPGGFKPVDTSKTDVFDNVPVGKHWPIDAALFVDKSIYYIMLIATTSAPYQVYAYTPVGILTSHPLPSPEEALMVARTGVQCVVAKNYSNLGEFKRAFQKIDGFRPKTITVEAFANKPKSKGGVWFFNSVPVSTVSDIIPEAETANYAQSSAGPNKIAVVYGKASTSAGGYVLMYELARRKEVGYFRPAVDPRHVACLILNRTVTGAVTTDEIAAFYAMDEIKL